MDRDQIFFASFRRLFLKELRGIGTTRCWCPVGAIPTTTLVNRVKSSITIDPTVGSRSNFFHEFPKAVFSMEWHGFGTTRCRRLVWAIPPTTLEKRVKRSITIYPTVGSRLNFFHEFPVAVFEGVEWNRYDTRTATGRSHSTDSAREPGQKVHNYRSDRWIALKCFLQVSRGCFRGS